MFSINLKGSWYFIPLRTTCPNMHQEQAQQEKKVELRLPQLGSPLYSTKLPPPSLPTSKVRKNINSSLFFSETAGGRGWRCSISIMVPLESAHSWVLHWSSGLEEGRKVSSIWVKTILPWVQIPVCFVLLFSTHSETTSQMSSNEHQ